MRQSRLWQTALLSLLVSSCVVIDLGSFTPKQEPKPAPEKRYNAEVVWVREVLSNSLYGRYYFSSPPVVAGPHCYFLANETSIVVKINLETGKVLWESERVEGQYQGPQKIGGYVYQPSGNGSITVIDDSNGNIAATVMLGEHETEALDNDMRYWNSVTVSGDYLLWGNFPRISDYASGLMRLDSRNIDFTKDPYEAQAVIPELIWSDGETQITSQISSGDGIVYFLNMAGMLIAMDTETGTVIWEQEVPFSEGRNYSYFPLALYGEKILVMEDNLSCYNKYSGDFIFEIAQFDDADSRPYNDRARFTLHNNFLFYINVYNNTIIAVNIDTGEIAWKNDVYSHYDRLTQEYYEYHYYGSLAHVYGDSLFVMSDAGLRVYNAANGKFAGIDKRIILDDAYSVLYNDILVFFGYYPEIYGAGHITAIRCLSAK